MRALLEIQSGKEIGRQHWIEPGMTLGRKDSDILISDPKISAVHAEVVNENRRMLLRDRKSTHGLWDPDEKVPQISLSEGAVFKMGETLFKILQLEVAPLDRAMKDLLAALQSAPGPAPRMNPFPVLLGLKFLQGPHEGEVWPLGYGPRTVGTSSLDLYLYDPDAREECFTLDCQDEQVILTTPHSHFVKVNDQYVERTPLKPDDLVSLGQSLIQVTILTDK